MLNDDKDNVKAKRKISRIYHMANKLFKDEFKIIFNKSRVDFRDWLNEKTNLKEDHIVNRDEALSRWLKALEFIYRRDNMK